MEAESYLRTSVIGRGKERMVEVSDVDFIDGVGLRALLSLQTPGRKLTLVSPSRVVRRLITLAGTLLDAFVLIDEVSEPVG